MIDKLKDLEGRIATLEEALKNVLRVGTVVARDEATCRVRVQLRDNDRLVSWWCQVLMKKTHLDKEYWLPDIDELVVCAFLPYGHEQGFVLGSAYNAEDRPPQGADGDMYMLVDKIGNRITMNRQTGIIEVLARHCVRINPCP